MSPPYPPYQPFAPPPPVPPRRSPWLWVGLGCGGLALLSVCVLLVFAIVLLGGLGGFSTSP